MSTNPAVFGPVPDRFTDDPVFPAWRSFAPASLSTLRMRVVARRRLRWEANETPAVRACRVWQEFVGERDPLVVAR